jgi:UDP-GlcNAc:undecaprenyl-phosphate/decaprenyl-phosphate GlcNAc-1-phosphate transferase
MEQLIGAFLFGFAAAVGLVPLCRLLAFRIGCVARPSGDRWHKRPTPLLGGLAIFASVAAGAGIFGIAAPLWLVLLTGAIIFTIGATDDLISLKPSTKLIAEIAVSSVLLFFGYRLGWSSSLTIDALLTLVWMIGVTNAFNLLDNMDGLCAGVALVAGATLLASLDPAAAAPQTIYLGLLTGALGGFLVYNVNPASIFMGDSGSLFVGLTFATLTLSASSGNRSNLFSILAAPVLILLIPIFDTTLVTVMRLLSGRSAAQGGRDHSSHRLVAVGLSERYAVSVLWILAALAGGIGLALANGSAAWSAPVALLFLVGMVIFAVYLSRVRVYQESDRQLLRVGSVTPFVVRFMYKRRVAEVILDVALVSVAYYAAYRLRFDDAVIGTYFRSFLQSLPIVLAVQMVAFFVVGVYRGVWRLFSLMDAVVIAKGVLLGSVTIVLAILYLFRFTDYSRGVFIIYAALLMLMVVGSRASFRLMSEFVRRRRRGGERLLIYGAGQAGAIAVRELLGNPQHDYRMLGFIDDDEGKRGSQIQGYPVLSNFEGLVSLIEGGAVDRVIISTRDIPGIHVQHLEAICAEKAVALSRLDFRLEHLVAAS